MLNEALNLLKSFEKKIPESVLGPERVSFIIKNIHYLNNDHKLILHQLTNRILSLMLEKEASDIEIGGYGSDSYIWLRIHGKKERVKELPRLSIDQAGVLIASLLNASQCEMLTENRNLDFSYTFKEPKKSVFVRFRADAYYDLDCLALNMRAISADIRPVESLGFHPAALKTLSHNFIKFGLTLITGITGSGKSSTLDSIIDYHNKFDPAHIVIIASPVEYVHRPNISLLRHREVGRDVRSFKEGVIQSLRQDPDIIVIGEMRDPETIMSALEVTDTGHKVFSTLHTSSAVESIDRIIAEVHPTEQERVRNRLADVLISVVSQKLVPSIDGKRVLAKEVLVVTPSVKAAIKNNNTGEIYGMIMQSPDKGMITMEQDLIRLYRERKISQENAIAYANNKTRIMQQLKAL